MRCDEKISPRRGKCPTAVVRDAKERSLFPTDRRFLQRARSAPHRVGPTIPCFTQCAAHANATGHDPKANAGATPSVLRIFQGNHRGTCRAQARPRSEARRKYSREIFLAGLARRLCVCQAVTALITAVARGFIVKRQCGNRRQPQIGTPGVSLSRSMSFTLQRGQLGVI